MSDPKKLTDLQRNWNITKQYVKESPSLPNILKALKYLLDGPSKYQTGQPEILPGFQLKGLMRGSQLESQLSKAKQEYNTLKQQSTQQVYSPQEETILRKYDSFPKMFGKVFKDQKPQIVKDSKGNSWFEFAIPKNLQTVELQYRYGGRIKETYSKRYRDQ